ncbi:hypothetical protein POTOM_022824 [Populus tomentosa]|uniref:ABC transporter domain-containing protein n=1 Tax=Populus tomentosa TaxID=118781 RepID=A0A8X7ZP22_POPTO|nr:hypothetical protein POTOM_022824 [Populus tomentosa]
MLERRLRTVKAYKISLEPTLKHGSTLVMHKKAKGGDVFTAGVSIVYGGLGLGGALINIKYFIEANIAASRIFEMIHKSCGHCLCKRTRQDHVRNCWALGLVGRSGSGKSTVINLLEKFYEPLRGHILLDGVDIKTLQLKWLRSQMGLVSQEPILFATSIKQNICFEKEEASMEEVMEAAKAANAHNFICQLPEGYNTLLQRNFIDDEVTSKAQVTGSSSSVVLDTGIANAEQKDDTSLSQSFSDEKKTNQQQDDNYSSPSLWQLMSMAASEWKPTLIGFIAALACGLIQPLHSLCMAALLAVYFTTDHNELRPKQMILTGVNLQIDAAKVAAIVGRSGSGKSTIIKLIERFYDTSRGSIDVDSINIKSYNLRALRSHIALNATEAEIIEAATIANAHDFISSMEDGYETYRGERGVQLSGGQKQRIALARAILKNPTILLLDEATSSLDVNSALERTMTGRTCLVVAHRLSTIQKADKIAVIDQGRIIEEGNHFELINKGEMGAYFSLVKLQQLSAM